MIGVLAGCPTRVGECSGPTREPRGPVAGTEGALGRQRGSGTVLVAGLVVVLTMIATGLLVVAGYVAAAHHARAAADLVALSGAAAHARGKDGCAAARAIAGANGVGLRSCRVQGDSLDFVVVVTVSRDVRTLWPLLPDAVSASATAGRLDLMR